MPRNHKKLRDTVKPSRGGKSLPEPSSRGNKHVNVRRPNGPPCGEPGCVELFASVYPNFRCPASRVVRGIIRSEKQDVGTRRYVEAAATRPVMERRRRDQELVRNAVRPLTDAGASRAGTKPGVGRAHRTFQPSKEAA